MANPIIKIKTGNQAGVYPNDENIIHTSFLKPLETGELAYNAANNGLYIGYNGINHLISVANSESSSKGSNIDFQYFHGALIGNADTATTATLLGSATKGSSTKPIYLASGSPTACGDTLEVNISKNAATATTWETARNFSISGTASDTTIHSVNGSADIELTLPKTLDGFTSISAGTFSGALATDYLTGILPLNKGGTGINMKKDTRTPNAIIRYTSSAADYFSSTPTANGAFYATSANGSPQFGTLPVAQGGTGTTSQTANRMIISSADGASIISSNHFADAGHLYVNYSPSSLDQYVNDKVTHVLYVNGPSRFNGDIYLAGSSARGIYPEGDKWSLGGLNIPFDGMYSKRISICNSSTSGPSSIYISLSINPTDSQARMIIGNALSKGSVEKAYGLIRIYGHSSNYTEISKDITNDSDKNYNNHLYLPEIEISNYEGEFVIHANNTQIGSSSLPAYVAASGLVTACTPEDVFNDFSESLDTTNGLGQTLSLTIADKERSVKLSAATDSYGGIITTQSQDLAGDKTLKGNYFSQGTNPYYSFKNSAGVIQGYVQYTQSSNDFAIGSDYAKSLQITPDGSISIPKDQTITPRTDNSGSVGTSSYEWNAGYFRNLKSDSTIYITPTSDLYLQCGSSKNIYADNILPESDMGYSLGSTSYTWKSIHSHGITLYDGTNGYEGGSIYTTSSNKTEAQSSYVILGNGTSTGVAGNRYGMLRLYTEGAPYFDLRAHRYSTNSTSAAATTGRVHYLRDHGKAEAYLAATTTRDQVGSGTKPVYVSNAGVLTESSSTVGASAKPIYLSSGTLTESSSTLGATDTPIYMSAGELKACTSSKGSSSVPVYMSSGQILQCTASSIFSSFTSSTNTLSITVCGQTRTASIVNSISNTWAGGTTAGPTLKTTVNGVAGTAVAIPVATASASGVVTTGTQTFAGAKTFNSTVTATRFIVSSTSGVKHIEFSRAGYNYLTGPAGSTIAVCADGVGLGADTAQLIINSSSVHSGSSVSLGTSSKPWSYVYGRNFTAKNSTSSASNAAFTVQNYDGSASISLLYGSGQSNVGLYDNVTDAWILYRPLGSTDEMSRKTTRFNHGVAFTGSHGTGNPGTSTNGYGVSGAVYFKRI